MKIKLKENYKVIFVILLIIILSLVLYFIFRDKEEGFKYEYKEYYLKNYKINELIPVNITEEQMAVKYLSEYTKLILFNPEKAYDLVDDEYKEIKMNTIEKFKEYFKGEEDFNFYDAKVVKYSISQGNKYKEFYVVDSSDNTYIFREYSINNYKVLFDAYTI